jgi:hypothetical protein
MSVQCRENWGKIELQCTIFLLFYLKQKIRLTVQIIVKTAIGLITLNVVGFVVVLPFFFFFAFRLAAKIMTQKGWGIKLYTCLVVVLVYKWINIDYSRAFHLAEF